MIQVSILSKEDVEKIVREEVRHQLFAFSKDISKFEEIIQTARKELLIGHKEKYPNEFSLDRLDMSVRLANILAMAGIENVGQLCSKRIDELFGYRGFGKQTMREVEFILMLGGRKPADCVSENGSYNSNEVA